VEASELTARAAREKAGPRVVQLVNRYESENKQREITELTRRSELQSAQLLQRELQQRWLWTVVGVSRNISERKAAEAAREVALSEARRLAHQRSQFLAHMSHELRTPLNAMMGFARILQRDESLTERAAKAIRVISESGQHLLRLINDILDLARIDAGKLELFPSEIDLAVFLQVVCDTIQVRAEDKGLRFVFDAAADLPGTVCVDEKRLRQVLLNLLSNAVKFTDSGQVTLRVMRMVPPADVPIVATSANATAEVEASGRAAGANAFVGKPIQEAALLQVIAALLQLEWLREGPKEQLGDS
jgi:signal transduction histidine kinase